MSSPPKTSVREVLKNTGMANILAALSARWASRSEAFGKPFWDALLKAT